MNEGSAIRPSSPVRGHCRDDFAAVRALLAESIASGEDLGASVAVVVDGELVVDLWGGWVDAEQTKPWTQHTLANVFSTSKTVMALAALLLVDRGELDVDAPVARYWPEFAANGKDAIEVRHLLSHSSGVCGWDQPVTRDDLYDWDRATSMLARQAPWYQPGSAPGYQLVSFNYLVGEIIRRVTGSLPWTFIDAELSGPLGADFHLGLAPSEAHRLSPMVPPPPVGIDFSTLDPTSVMMRAFMGPPPAMSAEDRNAERVPINAFGNARSVARLQSVVSHGGAIDGRRFLSDATINTIFREQVRGTDLVLGLPVRFGVGYALSMEPGPVVLPGRVCFWGGAGGSRIVNLLDDRVTFAYVMNRMTAGFLGDARSARLLAATVDAVRGGSDRG